jgi:hypothetical protein
MVLQNVRPVKMFEVFGPFPVKPKKGRGGKVFDKELKSKFWADNPTAAELLERVGCYIFAIRAAKGFKPVYVGKTAKSFEKEIFTADKLQRYNSALCDVAKGTPVMFFVAHPKSKGILNSKMIVDIEDYLIQIAYAKNPDLKNVIGIVQKAWGIKGVLRSGKGKASKPSAQFKQAMGI